MKKEWIAPMVEDLDLASTAYDAFTGTVPDGEYEDENCEYQVSYES